MGIRNRLTGDDQIELLLPKRKELIRLDPAQMTGEDGLALNVAHNGYRVYFPLDQTAPAGSIIRRAIR